MKNKAAVAVLMFVLIIFFGIVPAAAVQPDNSVTPEYDNIGIGGGGAFLNPMIDPADSDVMYVTSDMDGLYYTHDGAQTWQRTESRGELKIAGIAADGTVFAGGYGLYASFDKGESLQLIYPQNVLYSVSRAGWNENLMTAPGYDNGYLKCVATDDSCVYFATVSWYGVLRVIKCEYNGDNAQILYTAQLDTRDPVSGVNMYMSVYGDGLYFTVDNVLFEFDFTAQNVSTVYEVDGKLKDFEKIGEYYFILNDKTDATEILYTQDFINFSNLDDLNTLSNEYTDWRGTHTFNRHFKQICGNGFNSIFLSFASVLNDTNQSVEGIIKFNGETFEWVFDSMNKTRATLSKKDWSYNCYGPFFGIASSVQDDSLCLVANIETVYIVKYSDADHREVYSTHCTTMGDGTYTTTGLNVQTTYSVHEDPFNSDHLIIASTDLGLQNSYNNGESWARMKITGSEYRIYNTCYDIYFDTEMQDTVYALWSSRHDAPYNPSLRDRDTTLGSFAVSHDGGNTWDFSYSTGLPADCIPVKMSVEKKDTGFNVAVATFNRGFFISFDSGKTFSSLNDGMTSREELIFGEDVVLCGDTVYCLTAPYNDGTWNPGELYIRNLSAGTIKKAELGDIILPRSLTYNETEGLLINVIASYSYKWLPELNTGMWVNVNGGIYRFDGEAVTCIFETENGVFNSGFAPDGTLYAVDTYGKVFVRENGEFRLYVGGLFNGLKNVSFSPDGETMYITCLGGGVYRMPTLKMEIVVPETTTEASTEEPTEPQTSPGEQTEEDDNGENEGFFAWLKRIFRIFLSWFGISI